jgi:S1-C subfamily serine protease
MYPRTYDIRPSERGESYAHAAALTYECHDIMGMGSGWAIDEDTLVTNWHVVSRWNLDDQWPEWVEQGDTGWAVASVERLPGIDGALVHVIGDPLKVAEVRPTGPTIGEWLLMVGSPHDSHTPIVTWGLGAGWYRPGEFAIDGAIIPGMSGGPVLDREGRVIGMNVATTVPPGRSLGIIIPIEEILDALGQLEQERASEPEDRGGGQGDPVP